MEIRTDQLTPAQSLFLARQLEEIMPTLLETKRPPRNFARLFDIDTSVPSGARTYTQRMIDSVGRAVIGTGRTTAVPTVSVGVAEETRNIRYLLAAYDWTVFEIREAARVGMSLDMRLAMAARDTIERRHNEIFWAGDATNGLFGVLTHPNIPRSFMPNAIVGTAADTVIADLLDLLDSVEDNTETAAIGTDLILAPEDYNYCKNTRRLAGSDITILQAVASTAQDAGQTVTIHKARELTDAFTNAAGGTQNVCIARRVAPEVMRGVIPGGEMFESLAPQFREFRAYVPCYGATGGVASDYPLEMTIGIVP